MKSYKRKFVGMLLVTMAICCFQSVPTKAAIISPLYVATSRCIVRLSFNDKSATCTSMVTGKQGTTSISGTLKLYDETAKKSVKSWTISKTGSSYTGSKTATVKAGHKYKLSFSGKAYDKNGKSESVSASTTKKNS